MTNRVLIVLLCIVPLSVTAANKEAQQNYCQDSAENKEFDDLLGKYPTDKGIIRLFAMRKGLCEMIGKQQISLETGIALWAIERQKILTERTKKS